MSLTAAIHARWAAAPALCALLPAERLFTGRAPGPNAEGASATLAVSGAGGKAYANDRSSVDEVQVAFRIGPVDFDQGEAIAAALLAAFDRSDFELAGGGKVVSMQRSAWPEAAQDPASGRWLWRIEFQCRVQLPGGA